MRKEVIDVVVDLEPMSLERTIKWLKDKGLYGDLKKAVSKGDRIVFDAMLDVVGMINEFGKIYIEEINDIGHDLLWEAVLAEVGEQETVEDKIHRLEAEIKALKERKEDDLK